MHSVAAAVYDDSFVLSVALETLCSFSVVNLSILQKRHKTPSIYLRYKSKTAADYSHFHSFSDENFLCENQNSSIFLQAKTLYEFKFIFNYSIWKISWTWNKFPPTENDIIVSREGAKNSSRTNFPSLDVLFYLIQNIFLHFWLIWENLTDFVIFSTTESR